MLLHGNEYQLYLKVADGEKTWALSSSQVTSNFLSDCQIEPTIVPSPRLRGSRLAQPFFNSHSLLSLFPIEMLFYVTGVFLH
jgi:hypothetical protein